MKIAALASAGILMAAASDAEASNGIDIERWCENDPAVALAYIEGVIDAYATVGPPIDYCLSEAATYGDVRDVVCKWVSNYPEERHRAGALLVPVALREAWPCKG